MVFILNTITDYQVPSQSIRSRGARPEEPIDPKIELQMDLVPTHRTQLLSTFLDSYVNRERLQDSIVGSGILWIQSIPDHLGRFELFDQSVTAMCLSYVGKVQKVQDLIVQGYQGYHKVLKIHQFLMARGDTHEDVLATSMIMALYEVSKFTQLNKRWNTCKLY
jgi:hypothetical protein